MKDRQRLILSLVCEYGYNKDIGDQEKAADLLGRIQELVLDQKAEGLAEGPPSA